MTVNVGTVRGRSSIWPPAGRSEGIGARSAEARARGGAAVVLRAGESPAHGEGRQHVSQGGECNVRRYAGEHRRQVARRGSCWGAGTENAEQAAPLGGRRQFPP